MNQHYIVVGVCSKTGNNDICEGCKEWCYVNNGSNDYGSKNLILYNI